MNSSSLGTRALFFFILIYFVSGYPLSPQSGVLPFTSDVDVVCPDVIWENETAGHIYSPNYPNNYSSSSDCTYVIQGEIGSRIVLVFYVFETESIYDYVTLYDGSDTNAKEITSLSGENTTDTFYTSSGSTMTVTFHSDAFDNRLGFYAGFIVTSAGIIENPTGLTCPDNVYKDALGVIVSPHYPSDYPSNADCEYLIGNGTEDTYILFTIEHFVTEGEYDYLELHDGKDNTSPMIIQLSGTTVEGTHYSTTGPYAYARFVSDAFKEESGFSITYQILVKGSTTPLTPIELLKSKVNNLP